MLDNNKFGYAVMTKELDAYSIADESLEVCKKYCYEGYVVVEQIPYVVGFSFRILFHRYVAPFNFKFGYKNILWLHWSWSKEYLHRKGKVVYRPGGIKDII